MSFRIRWLAVAAVLGIFAVANAQAQRGFRSHRPAYGYFKYRVPRMNTFVMPRTRLNGAELRLRALERSFDNIDRQRLRQLDREQQARGRALALADRARTREFVLRDRALDRRFELENRALRRQLDVRERMLDRFHDRFDRIPRIRVFRPRVRTI